ncbi:MAG: alkaline phosphatase [Deferribacterales bacterium]
MKRRDFLKGSMASFIALLASSEDLLAKVSSAEVTGAKGVIFLVGDGFPLGVMEMMYEFLEKRFKEESTLSKLLTHPNTSIHLTNTSSLSSVVTDSAPASVAWGTGSKTANRFLSSLPDERKLTTIFELAKEKGLSCGVVTTTRITHATPAAWYSHQINRNLEEEIAVDLLKSGLDLAMGGGDRYFSPEKRKDKRDIYREFTNKGYNVVKTKSELTKIDLDKPILGVFSDSHISYFVDRVNDKKLGDVQPSLPEMTSLALQKLSINRKGFVLQIEAGRIDHACHANDAFGAMMDAYELDKTITVIKEFIQKNPNVLLIITSDHGNSGFGINGTGPDYNDASDALMNYQNTASFEYMIKKMKGETLDRVKDIFEFYTKQNITNDEAEQLFKALNEKRTYIDNDFVYEPEATMGLLLRKSRYNIGEGKYKLVKPAELRRGNVGFTSTNHTAEDQLTIIYSAKKRLYYPSRIDNTDLFRVMTNHLGIKYKNTTMSQHQALNYLRTITAYEWDNYLRLHIS